LRIQLGGTIEESRKAAEQGGGGESKVVFEIKGSKGSGKFIIESNNGGQGSAVLLMPDGTRHPVDIAGGGDMDIEEMEDLEIELNEFIDTGDAESPEPVEVENN